MGAYAGNTQNRQYFGFNILGVEPGNIIHRLGRGLVNKNVGQDHRTILEAGVENPMLRQKLGHMASKAANRAFFDGDKRLVIAGKAEDHLLIQRLGKTGIDDRGRNTPRGQRFGRKRDFLKARAKRKKRHALALADHPRLADLERLCVRGDFNAHAFATGKPEGNRAVVVFSGGHDHTDQLGLVGRGHNHETGKVGKEGHIKAASMGRAIGTDKAASPSNAKLAEAAVVAGATAAKELKKAKKESDAEKNEKPEAKKPEAELKPATKPATKPTAKKPAQDTTAL